MSDASAEFCRLGDVLIANHQRGFGWLMLLELTPFAPPKNIITV